MQLGFEEIAIVAVLAVLLIGPERLPTYAEQLARLVRTLRDMARGATATIKEELGPEAADLDFSKLDPRQYDPRRIVRDALLDDEKPTKPSGTATKTGSSIRSSSTTSKPATGSSAGEDDTTDEAAASGGATTTATDSDATDTVEPVDPLANGAPYDDEAT
ncbi:twin-arginine translocase TatA/TatE family subunit [Ruania alba]|uniref:Sec-independent protein translocase protein TatB n=1 Tax=Ruania alba TaxID=648782 RepID=A0A1H5CTD9_9MICO|nr:twin-arginine translocase TatA/TatE family subunit [Ruania alba]SED69750.1 sec-independent protein translocase protein TatB [Ruania alba]